MQKIPDFSNDGLLGRLHCWIIRLVAGKKVVILNAGLGVVDHDGRSCAAMVGVKDAYIDGVQFDLASGKMVEIREAKTSFAETVRP